MIQFAFHPNVYHTHPQARGLLQMLEQIWVRGHQPGVGTFYIISGFANYNGGVRFYEVIDNHIRRGGACVAIFGGSASQRLSSQQVVRQLLEIGCQVHIINRKRILHAKCYGSAGPVGENLVVSSGNFTGPGMSQNAEASLFLDPPHVSSMGFSWPSLIQQILHQKWDIHQPSLQNSTDPAWSLLYDELSSTLKLDIEQEVTMLVTLVHADTARIQASVNSKSGLGTQYFWLSKDSYDFFPALTLRNKRGHKATYSAIINMYYVDLQITDTNCRVTFEAENNLDFRLGTAKLKFTKLAKEGDMAAITRTGEFDYELRIIRRSSPLFSALNLYAVNFIGHKGKKFGYIPNNDFYRLISPASSLNPS